MEFTGIEQSQFHYGGHVMKLYFETLNFEDFVAKAKGAGVGIISETIMPYGQKVLRFYDPDKHIVEIGEDFGVMVHRLHNEEMTKEEISEKTFLPLEAIDHLMSV